MSREKDDDGGRALRLLSSVLGQRRLLGHVRGGGSPLGYVGGGGCLLEKAAWHAGWFRIFQPCVASYFKPFTGS